MKPRNHPNKRAHRRARARARAFGASPTGRNPSHPEAWDTRFRIGAAAHREIARRFEFEAVDYSAIELRMLAALDECSCGGSTGRPHSSDTCPLRAVQEFGV